MKIGDKIKYAVRTASGLKIKDAKIQKISGNKIYLDSTAVLDKQDELPKGSNFSSHHDFKIEENKMKKSELRQIIKEEIQKIIKESMDRKQMINYISSEEFGNNSSVKQLQNILYIMTGKRTSSDDEYDLLSDIGEVSVDKLSDEKLKKIISIEKKR